MNIRVQPTLDDEAVVEMPSEGYSIEVADVAERHGGVEPTNPGEMDRLRAAMAEARQTQREARRRIGRAQDAMEQAVDAIRRRRDNQGNEPN